MQMLNADGKGTHWETWRLTMNPPRGYQVEAIAGPTKGTKFAQTYTSIGNKTRVDVEGDWVVPGADDATIRASSLTSTSWVSTRTPNSASDLAASPFLSARRPQITTSPPARAMPRAKPRPMPALPPLTRTTRPAKLNTWRLL